MKRNTVLFLAVLFVLTSFVVASCASTPTPEPTAAKEAVPTEETVVEEPAPSEIPPTPEPFTLTIAVPNDVSTLDIHFEPTTTLNPHYQLYDSLVMRDDNGGIQPGLATSWEAIDDTTWEFTLREGVKFHNGEDFTAEDVKFSIDRIMEAGEDSGPRKQYAGWFESVEVVDDFTVRIHTQTIFPVVLGNIARQHTILPKDYVESVGDEEFAKNPVGTGPYRFVEWNVNESVVLEAFDGYWGGRPEVDSLIFRVIPDESTRIAEMLTGGVDILVQVPPARIGELEDAGVKISSTPSVTNFYLGIATSKSPFDDVNVRMALAHALDINTIIDTILEGTATQASTLVQNTSFGWNPHITPYEYNPDLARQLLEDAGYADGFTTSLDAGLIGIWPASKEVAEVIAAQLGEVGVNVELNVGDFGDYFTRYREDELTGLFLWGNAAATQDADTHLYLNFRCPPDGRGIYYCSEETDAQILDARVELDTNTREQLYWQLQENLHELAVTVPLWQFNVVSATGERVQWNPRADGLIYVNTVAPLMP